MIDPEMEIQMSGEQTIKAKSLLALCKQHIIDPLRSFIKAESDSLLTNEGKTKYADVIVYNGKGEILLLQRSYQDDVESGKWCLPGGHVDLGEDSYNAAKRELAEETGLNVDSVRAIGKKEKDNCIIHYYDVFVIDPKYSENGLLAAPTAMILDNDEHYRYQWVSRSDLKNYDLIFDLGSYIEDFLIPTSFTAPVQPVDDFYKWATQQDTDLEEYMSIVKKAFDEDQISEDQYIKATTAYNIKKTENYLKVVEKAFDDGLMSEEKYVDIMNKSGLLEN